MTAPPIVWLRASFAGEGPRAAEGDGRSSGDEPTTVVAVDLEFDAELWEWRGPAPFYWLTVPDEGCDYIRFASSRASYGWGAIPVRARIGATEWETSLLPKDGGYVLPVKQLVRKAERIDEGDTVAVALAIAPRGGRPAN
jgi:hypothetical protein